jgi:hypothetical protein
MYSEIENHAVAASYGITTTSGKLAAVSIVDTACRTTSTTKDVVEPFNIIARGFVTLLLMRRIPILHLLPQLCIASAVAVPVVPITDASVEKSSSDKGAHA